MGKMKLLRVRNHRKRRTKSDRSGAKCDRIPRMQSHEYEHAINREHDGSLRASAREDQLNKSHHSHKDRNRYSKPLKVPTFNGDKRKFEGFWALFTSLVDESTEPVNLKMARLRQCLTGNALEAIRGLGVTVHKYEEAKGILKTKYGSTRRLLRAYLDQLEQAPLIRSNDIHAYYIYIAYYIVQPKGT